MVYEVRGFLEETWRSRTDADVADSDRYRASREVETACMRDADAVVTLSETMRRRHPRARWDRPGPGRRRPERRRRRAVRARPARPGAGRPGRGRRRSGHRLHLELHRRTRGSATSSRGPPSSAGAVDGSAACSSGMARSGPRWRPPRPRPASTTARSSSPGASRTIDVARLLPADRRLRRPAHERPGLAARHAAQALRGDGDGARPGRERGRGPARDRRRRRDGPIVPTRRTRSTWPTWSSHSSTTRPSESAWAGPPGSGSPSNRTWRQNGARYRALYERLGVA